jgi:O-antigen/teichoic acid export membrane protein
VTTATTPTRLQRLLDSGGVIAVAIMVMNVATYGFQMVAARLMGPNQYGGLASLLALMLIVGVLQLGLQAAAARRIAADPDDVGRVEHGILRVAYWSSLLLFAVLVVLSPLVERMLRLDSIYPALLVALGAIPLTVMGAQAGILQGERRWRALALVYLAAGVPRLVIGTGALLVRPTEGSAMAAVTLAWFAPMVVGWFTLRGGNRAQDPGDLRPLVAEIWHGSFALLAFFALSNVDILLARNVLSDRDSGLYAAGLILTKAVLFLPQFVTVVAFPAMSTADSRRRALLGSLASVGVLGVVCIAGAVLLSGVAMVFIGGTAYGDVEGRLWLFALLGTLLASLQLVIYAVLARQSRRSAYLVWAGVAVVTLVGLLGVSSLTGLVALVCTVDAVLLAILLALSLWRMKDDPVAAQ